MAGQFKGSGEYYSSNTRMDAKELSGILAEQDLLVQEEEEVEQGSEEQLNDMEFPSGPVSDTTKKTREKARSRMNKKQYTVKVLQDVLSTEDLEFVLDRSDAAMNQERTVCEGAKGYKEIS